MKLKKLKMASTKESKSPPKSKQLKVVVSQEERNLADGMDRKTSTPKRTPKKSFVPEKPNVPLPSFYENLDFRIACGVIAFILVIVYYFLYLF